MKDRSELVNNWLAKVETKKQAAAEELEAFELLVAEGNFDCDEYNVVIKEKVSTKVDQDKAWSVINDDVRNPEKNFGVNPFRLKVEIDKKKMDAIREMEPRYYELVIVPMLTVKPAKPTIKVTKGK